MLRFISLAPLAAAQEGRGLTRAPANIARCRSMFTGSDGDRLCSYYTMCPYADPATEYSNDHVNACALYAEYRYVVNKCADINGGINYEKAGSEDIKEADGGFRANASNHVGAEMCRTSQDRTQNFPMTNMYEGENRLDGRRNMDRDGVCAVLYDNMCRNGRFEESWLATHFSQITAVWQDVWKSDQRQYRHLSDSDEICTHDLDDRLCPASDPSTNRDRRPSCMPQFVSDGSGNCFAGAQQLFRDRADCGGSFATGVIHNCRPY